MSTHLTIVSVLGVCLGIATYAYWRRYTVNGLLSCFKKRYLHDDDNSYGIQILNKLALSGNRNAVEPILGCIHDHDSEEFLDAAIDTLKRLGATNKQLARVYCRWLSPVLKKWERVIKHLIVLDRDMAIDRLFFACQFSHLREMARKELDLLEIERERWIDWAWAQISNPHNDDLFDFARQSLRKAGVGDDEIIQRLSNLLANSNNEGSERRLLKDMSNFQDERVIVTLAASFDKYGVDFCDFVKTLLLQLGQKDLCADRNALESRIHQMIVKMGSQAADITRENILEATKLYRQNGSFRVEYVPGFTFTEIGYNPDYATEDIYVTRERPSHLIIHKVSSPLLTSAGKVRRFP